MSVLEQLRKIREFPGEKRTLGLADEEIASFEKEYPQLKEAVDAALEQFENIRKENPEILDLDEAEQVRVLQEGFLNFYSSDAVNPYVPLGARGPWMITLKGAVLHDNGGYGMLGLGHCPPELDVPLSRRHVMANIMTPSFYQNKFMKAIRKEIGHRRNGNCPYTHFLCLNSGSEVNAVAARICDINARHMTEPGSRHEGRVIKQMSLRGGFHGRTYRPAKFSHSCEENYLKHLASFRTREGMLVTVEPNNIQCLRDTFAEIEKSNVFIEAFWMEPVMGEGNPGVAIDPEFYKVARELTKAHGAMLLVDSIQAGLRTNGCLSIMDYPGFETLEPPEFETFSKAINGGQFPFSVLAMNERAAHSYRIGVYGNTMTGNPRALEVATHVLNCFDDELRKNIVDRGLEFKQKLELLQKEYPDLATNAQGTGLLLSLELSPEYKAYGSGSIEEYMRLHGIGVIHGGKNSLRYTPHFRVTSKEVDLIVAHTRDALLNGPRLGSQEE